MPTNALTKGQEIRRAMVDRFRNLVGYAHFSEAPVIDMAGLTESDRRNIEQRAQVLRVRRRASTWRPAKVTLELQEKNSTVGVQGDITFAASPDDNTRNWLKYIYASGKEGIFEFQMLGGSLEFPGIITVIDMRDDGFMHLEVLQTGPYTKELVQ